MFVPVVPISLATALNGTSRIRHLRTGATLLPSIATGTTIEHYLGDAEEFYPDEHPQILEREVGYIFPLMEVEPTICIELKNEEDEG